ncbi:MAG: hypothetical protein U0797_15355 [Gemmataceae bacterium]
MSNSPDVLAGRLSIYVAFDWGEEIDLERARQQGAGVVLDIARRPRTPRSIALRPPPLRFPLGPVAVAMPGLAGSAVRSAEATVFDFAGVSVAFHVPFTLPRHELRLLAARLNDPEPSLQIVQAAREAVEPLYHKLQPAISKPAWDRALSEEYFVFQFTPAANVSPDALLGDHADWLAGLLRLEDEPLSAQEVTEALRLTLRYGADDLFIPDWGAAVLVDREGESDETLQVIEFANLRLLEYRHIDRRIDDILGWADDLVRKASRSRLAALRGHHAAMRARGELRVDAGLFERTVTALRLVGDQYLARVYKLLATRFHLPEWERGIERKLEILEGVYQVASHRSSDFRSEFLEVLIVLLIVVEILISIFKH